MPTAALRPALELAWAVARAGLVAEPPVDPPRLLRPLVTFSRLPARALETVRRVLEDDAEFRARVATEADERPLGRTAWLFLSRPAGWEDEVGRAGRAAALAEETAHEDREERTARRQLRGAQDAARRAELAVREAEQALAAARARGSRMAEELATERGARVGAEAEAAELSRRVAGVERERDDARSRVARLEDQLAQSRLRLEEALARREQEAAGPPAAEVTAAVRAAAEAAGELSTVLDRIALVLGASAPGQDRGREPSVVGTPLPPVTGGPERVAEPRRPAPGARPPLRQPIRLPPAVLEDAPEAAEHLVRTDGVVLVVDGYNVSHACWPTLAIAEQRRRLVDALRELAARTGADVEVVFDGGEHGEPAPPGATREPVKTRFSPPGTEADDVILEMVERYPPRRPVVVATSDRRVREGVRRRGANVISAGQLLKVLRRDRGW